MIRVNLVLDVSGALVSALAQGHALHGSAGTDIVCAAVSVLMRTTVTVLKESAARLQVESASRGTLSLTVTACRQADFSLLRYAARFLQNGVGSLAEEYPESVGIHVETEKNSSIEVLED